MTKDQRYKWGSGTSVKSRIIKELLMSCVYGSAARRKHPNRQLMASKIHFKLAFRQCNLSAATAIQCYTQLPAEDLFLLYLHLTFEGCPCPNKWGAFSEPIYNLAAAILPGDSWDSTKLHLPAQNLVPPPRTLDDNVPFSIVKILIVDIEVNPRGTHDIYMDDMIPLMVDIPGTDNLARCAAASLLAIHATAQPKHPNEPIPREEMETRNKLSAEARIKEEKIILGWRIDFCRLIISLPDNKVTAILSCGSSTAKELETMIGQLGHLGCNYPLHLPSFKQTQRHLQRKATKQRSIAIPQPCRDNLKLMTLFVEKAFMGIDMNLISFQHPTHIYRSNSCPFGLGGYLHKGSAWRLEIQEQYCFCTSNNLLRFIASIITPWIDMMTKCLQPGDFVLLMTDSTTSAVWLKLTNFSEEVIDPIKATICLKISKNTLVFSSTTISRTCSGSRERQIMLLMLSLGILTSEMRN
jgi:hypothetical protein